MVRELDRVIARPFTSKHHAPTLLPTKLVFDQSVVVFGLDSWVAFGILSSRPHELWARFFGPTLKSDPRYAPTDCFETFPFPESREGRERLESVARHCYEFRAALMVRNSEGLTKTYNRFHDPEEHEPDILKLRELHDGMDRAVLDAYGWTEIQPRCEFILDYEEDEDDTPGRASRRRKPWRYRWPDEIRDEVLGRLLELNAERAREEELAGKGGVKSTQRGSAKRRSQEAGGLLEQL